MGATDVYAALGQAAARRRNELGLTQATVAAQLGLTRASLANIETGRQKVLLHHVYLLAEALRLDSILKLIPAALPKVEDTQQLKLGNDDLTVLQKAQVISVVKEALKPSPPTRQSNSDALTKTQKEQVTGVVKQALRPSSRRRR